MEKLKSITIGVLPIGHKKINLEKSIFSLNFPITFKIVIISPFQENYFLKLIANLIKISSRNRNNEIEILLLPSFDSESKDNDSKKVIDIDWFNEIFQIIEPKIDIKFTEIKSFPENNSLFTEGIILENFIFDQKTLFIKKSKKEIEIIDPKKRILFNEERFFHLFELKELN